MKQFLKYITICIFFVWFFPSTIFSLNSRHLLDRFEVLEDKKKPLLSFKGFFEPSQFLNIQINPSITKTKTTIIIPNSYINNLLFKEKKINSFPEDSILRELLINEDISKKENGEIISKVNIIVHSKDKHILEFDTENSDSRQLTFSIKKVKKKLITSYDDIEIQTNQSYENDFEIKRKESQRTFLLHPITALMSYRKFDQIKISVLNASKNQDAAHKIATMLDRQQKKNIEKRMGMNLKIINISSVNQRTVLQKTKIYFHPNFLRAALILSEVLPGEQILEPFPESRIRKKSNDLQIFVGNNFE